MSSTTYTVLARIWPGFAPKVARIERAAAKLGTRFSVTVSPERVEVWDDVPVRVVDVTVDAEVPRIAGWTFAAAVDHLEGGNILRVSPSFKAALPADARTCGPTCEHCGATRARKTTFVLTDGARFTRVGSSCLRDFTGHGDAEGLVAWAALVAEFESVLGSDDADGEEYGCGQDPIYFVARTVRDAFRAIDASGGVFTSSTAARNDARLESTAARILRSYRPKHRSDDLPEVTSEQVAYYSARAELALEWARGLTEDTDFAHNMRTVAGLDHVGPKHFGLAVYIAEGYRRHLGRLEEAKNTTPSVALGAAGDKVEFDFVLTGVRSFEGQYGVTTWYQGLAGANRVTIKSSTETCGGVDGVEVGTRLRVKGTVKAIETFRGVVGTVITRAKAVRLA